MSPLFPRFTMLHLMLAVAIAAVLFAALRYDVGRRGYLIFLAAFGVFAASSLVASRTRGRVRVAALTLAALSCLAGLATFLLFGTR